MMFVFAVLAFLFFAFRKKKEDENYNGNDNKHTKKKEAQNSFQSAVCTFLWDWIRFCCCCFWSAGIKCVLQKERKHEHRWSVVCIFKYAHTHTHTHFAQSISICWANERMSAWARWKNRVTGWMGNWVDFTKWCEISWELRVVPLRPWHINRNVLAIMSDGNFSSTLWKCWVLLYGCVLAGTANSGQIGLSVPFFVHLLHWLLSFFFFFCRAGELGYSLAITACELAVCES